MVEVTVKKRGGETSAIEAPEGETLMAVLRDGGFDVAGTCGGMCSCGSCHVFIGEKLLAALPKPSEDEQDMLDSLAEVIEIRPNSRLSCQIKISAALEGEVIEVGPEL